MQNPPPVGQITATLTFDGVNKLDLKLPAGAAHALMSVTAAQPAEPAGTYPMHLGCRNVLAVRTTCSHELAAFAATRENTQPALVCLMPWQVQVTSLQTCSSSKHAV